MAVRPTGTGTSAHQTSAGRHTVCDKWVPVTAAATSQLPRRHVRLAAVAHLLSCSSRGAVAGMGVTQAAPAPRTLPPASQPVPVGPGPETARTCGNPRPGACAEDGNTRGSAAAPRRWEGTHSAAPRVPAGTEKATAKAELGLYWTLLMLGHRLVSAKMVLKTPDQAQRRRQLWALRSEACVLLSWYHLPGGRQHPERGQVGSLSLVWPLAASGVQGRLPSPTQPTGALGFRDPVHRLLFGFQGSELLQRGRGRLEVDDRLDLKGGEALLVLLVEQTYPVLQLWAGLSRARWAGLGKGGWVQDSLGWAGVL